MEYRHRLAKAKEEEDNIPAATHIRNLTQQEHTRTLFRRIRYLERKMSNLSTSRIVISDHRGHPREVVKRDQVEYHIMKANNRKYHQAEGTSQLSKGQLLQDIRLFRTGPKVTNILRGNYKPPLGTSSATKEFLKEMRITNRYKRCTPIDFATFKEKYYFTRQILCKYLRRRYMPHFGEEVTLWIPNVTLQYICKKCIRNQATN